MARPIATKATQFRREKPPSQDGTPGCRHVLASELLMRDVVAVCHMGWGSCSNTPSYALR